MGRTRSGRFVGYHNHRGEEQSQRDSLSQPYVWRYGERTRDASMVASLALNREEGKWPLYERERPGTVKNTAKLIANLLSSRRMFPFLAETIVAGVTEGKPELYVLDPVGSLLPDKFAAVGTGAQIAIGVLELEYNEGLSVEQGEVVLLKAVRSALARDICSGDGIDLMVITEQGIKEESPRFFS